MSTPSPLHFRYSAVVGVLICFPFFSSSFFLSFLRFFFYSFRFFFFVFVLHSCTSYTIFFSSFSRSGCIGDHYPIFLILGNAGIYVVTCSSPRVRRTTVLFLSALCTRNEAIFIQYFILSHLLYPLVILCCYPLLAFCNYFCCSSAPTQLAWNAKQCTLFFPESAVTASCPKNVRLYSFEWVVLGFERVI